jgi:hypothetical protein
MTTNSNPHRRKLALRLFAVIATLNIMALMFFAPSSESTSQPKALPADHVELNIRASLHTSFQEHKKIWLMGAGGKLLGPAFMLSQNEESISLLFPKSQFQRHHQQLIDQQWALIPYVAQLSSKPVQAKGVTYEIAY